MGEEEVILVVGGDGLDEGDTEKGAKVDGGGNETNDGEELDETKTWSGVN